MTVNFKQILILLFLQILYIPYSFCQEKDSTCKVLLKEISGSYKGPCKNGLAEGKGIAIGEDSYKGNFQNGLPEGKGIYKYKNGDIFSGNFQHGFKNGKGEFKHFTDGKASTVLGYWKEGDYVGTLKPDDDFRITNISSIENYSIKKTEGAENVIEISFEKVMKKYIPQDLSITITSGYKIEQNKKILIQNYTCPVNCSLHFTIPTSGASRECNFAFTIYKPGSYRVFISNN